MPKEVEVKELPQCDFCNVSARYDGATTQGPWANMCESHFMLYGIGLGTGRGQRLVLASEKPKVEKPKAKVTLEQIMEAVEADDNLGFCLACGAQAEGVEPDARGYTCDNCGQPRVFGAEELLMMLG